MMKTTLRAALLLALAAASTTAFANDETTKPNDFSFNVGVTSDYRFRGLSQTNLKPAVQAGADFTTGSGFYVGTWASSVRHLKDVGLDGRVELDIYAGKRGNFTPEVGYDVGMIGYFFPNNNTKEFGMHDPRTAEIYGQLSYGPAYAKYSHATTKFFGIEGTKNSSYVDLGANFDLGRDFTLNLHAGRQNIKGYNDYDYNDYKVGVSKSFGVVTASVAAVGTNADKDFFVSPSGKFLGKTGVVASVSAAF